MFQSRSDLEQQSIETSNMSEAVGLVTYVQSLKRKMKSWEKQVDMYKEAQRLLERQRFQFPPTWLYRYVVMRKRIRIDSPGLIKLNRFVASNRSYSFWFSTVSFSYSLSASIGSKLSFAVSNAANSFITLIFHFIDGLLSTTAVHDVRRAGVLTCGSCHLERSARPHCNDDVVMWMHP